MINVSRFVATQREVRQLAELYVDQLKNTIRFNYRLPTDMALRDESIALICRDFLEEYSTTDVEWTHVLPELNDAVSTIRMFLVNSKSDEAPDYTTYAKEGNALTANTIRGLSLSRGLTIEGLTVSYIYRNSKMYDTLMQMGRWFGYRDGYEDVCRVYMSDVSYGWYCHISEAAEELRMQVKRMSRERKKPSDFGLYVRAHPDTLIVTAMNKMRHAENRAFRVSYDGKLVETHILPEAAAKNDSNRHLLKAFFDALGKSAKPHPDTTNSLLFRNVSWEYIQDFVLNFRFHTDMLNLQENIPGFIKEISDIYPCWDVAFKSLTGKQPEEGYMIAAQERAIGYESNQPRRPASETGWHTGSKNRFSGNSMFEIGLNDDQITAAMKMATDAGRKKPIYSDFTNARGRPLLMLHLLNLVDRNKDDEAVMRFVPALSVSFPNAKDVRTVEYMVNQVWLKQFEENQYDSPNEEDDYDLEP